MRLENRSEVSGSGTPAKPKKKSRSLATLGMTIKNSAGSEFEERFFDCDMRPRCAREQQNRAPPLRMTTEARSRSRARSHPARPKRKSRSLATLGRTAGAKAVCLGSRAEATQLFEWVHAKDVFPGSGDGYGIAVRRNVEGVEHKVVQDRSEISVVDSHPDKIVRLSFFAAL